MLGGKRILTITFVLLLILISTSAWGYQQHNNSKLKVDLVGFSPVVGIDSTIKLGNRIYVKNLVSSDTVVHTYYVNDTLKVTHRRVGSAAPDSTLDLKAPYYGTTNSYKGCVQIIRGSVKYPSQPVCWTWIYGRPLLPPGIDSVVRIVLRHSLNTDVSVNKDFQVCAFGITVDGRKVKMHNSWNNAECEVLFRSFVDERGV